MACLHAYGYVLGQRQNQYVDYVTRDGDGSQMSEAEFTEAIAEYQRLVNAGVKVNAIGLGSNINQEGLFVLTIQRLAAQL